jgi:hypothetical protein
MNRLQLHPARLLLPGAAALLALVPHLFALAAEPEGPRGQPPAEVKKVDLTRLKPGLTATEVRELLGQPKRVSRQILSGRYLEQWTFDPPNAVRIEFDWRKGQERQILTVQPLTAPAP